MACLRPDLLDAAFKNCLVIFRKPQGQRRCLLQNIFPDLQAGAGALSVHQVGAAVPDVSAMILGALVFLAALVTNDHSGEGAPRGLCPVRKCIGHRCQFLLCSGKGGLINNRGMGFFRVEHGELTAIDHFPLLDVVIGEVLPQQGVSGVLLASDLLGPPLSAEGTGDSGLVQRGGDPAHALAVKEAPENVPDHLSLLCVHPDSVFVDVVPVQETPVQKLTIFKALADPPLLVLAGRAAFFLRVGGEDGQHQLSLGAQRVDVLFFEVHVHTQPLQLPDGLQQRDRVTRQTREALRNDHIDFTVAAGGHHALEVLPIFLGPGQRLVRVHTAVDPAGVVIDQVAVVADLRGERVQHGILACGHSGVGRDLRNI